MNTEADPHPLVDSPGNVPLFSWEKKAGVSKTSEGEAELLPNYNLPPPPCTLEGTNKINISAQDFQIPLPPCAFQPPFYRTSSKKGLWMQDDDPFLAAYKQCTKTSKITGEKSSKVLVVLRKGLSIFSCKRSCSVRHNDLVRISNVPQNLDNRD